MQYQIDKLPNYTQARVLIYGDVMLDRYWYGRTERISFEAPVPIVDVDNIDERPGGAGNVAVNLAALGACVDLYGVVGNDDEAEQLKRLLYAVKINHHLLCSETIPTTTKLRIISRQQQLARLDFEESHTLIDCTDLQHQCILQLAHADVLVLSDYAKGVLHDPQALITAAKQHGVMTVIDPKKTSFESYRGATVVTPNFKEFQAVVGVCADEENIVARGMLLLERYDIQALLITRGSDGMTLLQKNQPPIHLASMAQKIYDVTGAGDTVIALLAAGLAAGQSLAEATYVANVAAGIAVEKMGTATVQIGELQSIIEDSAENHHVIYHQQQLLSIFLEKQRFGQRIVMLAGCFDILTRQHLAALNEAKQHGDCLLVVVFDEHTVEQQTGTVPIHTAFARQSALAGLAAVDWVFSTSLDGLLECLYMLTPDVLFLTAAQQDMLTPQLHRHLVVEQGVLLQRSMLDEVSEQAKIGI
jgi:D-beta-D-heptose 7-phosphate kinase / D-beta-D-heptose 1-phosphate adenosyltransferase